MVKRHPALPVNFEVVSPKYTVMGNLPAALAGAAALHPRLTRGFREYSPHRGFISDPARVRHPKDKPKVERGIQYVRERFSQGGEFSHLTDVREQVAHWCATLPDAVYPAPPRVSPWSCSLTRSLAGKPLAGFYATPSRRIPVLYRVVVHIIHCNTHYFLDNRR